MLPALEGIRVWAVMHVRGAGISPVAALLQRTDELAGRHHLHSLTGLFCVATLLWHREGLVWAAPE